ncbi:Uncharacterised protein [Chlamydia trachomatis]|nr:Uncharacterised protein [Chlamydia trachomatis]
MIYNRLQNTFGQRPKSLRAHLHSPTLCLLPPKKGIQPHLKLYLACEVLALYGKGHQMIDIKEGKKRSL